MKVVKENKRKIFYGVGTLLLVIVTMGVTYASFTYVKKGAKENTVSTGKISFEYNETSNGIELTDAMPVSDVVGKKSVDHYFDFHVKAEIIGNITIPYTVYGVDVTEDQNKLEEQYVKVYLTNQSDEAKAGYTDTIPTFKKLKNVQTPKNGTGKLLYQDQFSASGTHDYRIRMWVDESYVVTGSPKTFKMRVDVSTEAKIITKYKIPESIPMREFINTDDYEDVSSEEQKNMFVFKHEAGAQQRGWSEEELTDYRYIGADPNNYVAFNQEFAGWRIIGIFTVENEYGIRRPAIKLIRNQAINQIWDDPQLKSPSSPSNNWADATSMKAFNSSTGSTTFKLFDANMVGEVKWYLGGVETGNSTTNQFYKAERGTTVYNDAPTYWIGKVGLVYPSDYGYATSEKNCLKEYLVSYHRDMCKENDWIFMNQNIDTISPVVNSSENIITLLNNGSLASLPSFNTSNLRPVVYITNYNKITGTGRKEDPFVFSK